MNQASYTRHEEDAQEMLRTHGPREAFRLCIAANDALILSRDLDNGNEIIAARTAVHDVLLADWAAGQAAEAGYQRPFAVVALGGTGRRELTPCSDKDYAFLFDDELEGNRFLLHLQDLTLHSEEFSRAHGFSFAALPFALDDATRLVGKDLNSFLDMRAIHDPDNLADAFRARIRATFDPFQHFLHVREFLTAQRDKSPACDRLDHFDIKNDALRFFQGGVWTLAGRRFMHSHEIYRTLIDSRDLDAYYFLQRVRCWMHLRTSRRGPTGLTGGHPEDILEFDQVVEFDGMVDPESDAGERFLFANEVRARLLSARRRVLGFARGTVERESRDGRRVAPDSPILCGAGGLFHESSRHCRSNHARSSAALSLLLAAQHYGVPVDPSELQGTFHNAGDWLERVPEVAALFYESNGSLADSFAFLSQIDGAEERLFPGRAKFEASLDERVLRQRTETRGAMELRKLRNLENVLARVPSSAAPALAPQPAVAPPDDRVSMATAAAMLDADHLAAVKLALKTKRLPLTPDDEAARNNKALSLPERFSSGFSGIPLDAYYEVLGKDCGFTPETIAATRFLVANRRAFKSLASDGQNDRQRVGAFRDLCGTGQRLLALYVFTCADRSEWETEHDDPARWFLIRELFFKTLAAFRPKTTEPDTMLQDAGYPPEDRDIIRDFGQDFFSGLYRIHANRFGGHLVRMARDARVGPKAALLRDGASLILGIAARDLPGLAACICGALWKAGVVLRQAHCFTAANHRLVLDFFHLTPGPEPLPENLARTVEHAVTRRLHLDNVEESELPVGTGTLDIQETQPGKFRIRFLFDHNREGLVHAVCWKLFRHLHADIHGLSAQVTRTGPAIIIHCLLPDGMPFATASDILRQKFQ